MPDQREATVSSIRRAVEEVSRGERRNVLQLVRQLQAIRDALVARLAEGGTEFDQAFKRAMLVEVDRAAATLRTELSAGLGAQFEAAARAGVREMSRQVATVAEGGVPSLVGVDLDVLDFVRQETDNLVRGVSENVRTELQRIINSGAIGTGTRDDVIRRLGNVLTRENRDPGTFGKLATQVERIHRTETAAVFSLSKKATANKAVERSGRKASKRWVTVLDARTRPDHRALNGVVIPYDEHFNVGAPGAAGRMSWEEAGRRGLRQGEKADVPLDASLSAGQRINCRCAWSLVFGKALRQDPRTLLGIA